MKTVFELTDEELKTYIGSVMSDLRGSWSDIKSYRHRVEVVSGLLEILIKRPGIKPTDLQRYRQDLSLAEKVLGETNEGEEPDGRVFRKECYLYEYVSREGVTEYVKDLVDSNLEYPEYTSFYNNEWITELIEVYRCSIIIDHQASSDWFQSQMLESPPDQGYVAGWSFLETDYEEIFSNVFEKTIIVSLDGEDACKVMIRNHIPSDRPVRLESHIQRIRPANTWAKVSFSEGRILDMGTFEFKRFPGEKWKEIHLYVYSNE